MLSIADLNLNNSLCQRSSSLEHLDLNLRLGSYHIQPLSKVFRYVVTSLSHSKSELLASNPCLY